ncbi:putative transporter small subunit [Janibacter sp. CX7]|nr:putative transporter small subunit [Janibacter sp. CX7]UTT66261.1 putative transporter small subunit [Janibacter sp. CX7]
MSITALTLYILVWPAIVAVIFGVICVAFYKEWRAAKDEGRRII